MRLFGTNGIRGVANVDLTVDHVRDIGQAVAAYLDAGTEIAIGGDTRTSTPMFRAAVAGPLLEAGFDLWDLGMLPTPALQLNVKHRYDFGVMVTASHNPPQFNGLKCIAGDGTELERWQEERIEEHFARKTKPTVDWRDLGSLRSDHSAAKRYADAILAQVDPRAVKGKGLTVAIDCGNGAASLVAPHLIEQLGCRVVALNSQPQGTFPGRDSEPSEENLTTLSAIVKETKAALGVAFDGDADRAIFIDEKGRYLPGDKSFAIMARAVTEKKQGKVVTPVSSSRAVEEVVRKNKSEIVYTAVGAPLVARRMIEESAVFGGEENGGMIFPEHQVCRDGCMSAAKMIELVARRGPLSKLADSLPKYFSHKTKLACPEALKQPLLAKLKETAPSGADFTDGMKIVEGDAWALIRPSGTEDIFRIFAEARTPQKAKLVGEKWKAATAKAMKRF